MHYQLNMIWYLLCYFFVCSSVEAQPTTSIGQTNDKLIPILSGAITQILRLCGMVMITI